jgi:hypothetical protein
MKLFMYSFLFAALLFCAGIAFLSLTTPNIPQTMVTQTLDPKTAFERSKTPASGSAQTVPAPHGAESLPPKAPQE